ncbi:MAG: SOUL family heme-binding protein [Acetobacterium sp.]
MSKYETPEYKILEKDGAFEIRSYESYYTAAIEEASIKESKGFSQIFDYISGNNSKDEKISMTVPVINELQAGGVTTEFVMPHKYSRESLPDPSNNRIKIKKSEKRLSASVAFSGLANEKKIQKYQVALEKWLKDKNLEKSGSFRLARYNSPFIPPPLRRNEILIDIIKKE